MITKTFSWKLFQLIMQFWQLDPDPYYRPKRIRIRDRGTESWIRIRILDESERSTINYGGRWVAKLREMGGQVGSAPACYGSSLGSNPDMSQKYKMCDISKGLVNTLKPINKIYKKPVLRIRIRDPVPFWPLDPDPGSGIGFFRIPDPGSRIPDPNPICFRA